MKQPSIPQSDWIDNSEKAKVLFRGLKLSFLSHNFLLFSDVCVQKRFWTLVSSMSYRSFILYIWIGIELYNIIKTFVILHDIDFRKRYGSLGDTHFPIKSHLRRTIFCRCLSIFRKSIWSNLPFLHFVLIRSIIHWLPITLCYPAFSTPHESHLFPCFIVSIILHVACA